MKLKIIIFALSHIICSINGSYKEEKEYNPLLIQNAINQIQHTLCNDPDSILAAIETKKKILKKDEFKEFLTHCHQIELRPQTSATIAMKGISSDHTKIVSSRYLLDLCTGEREKFETAMNSISPEGNLACNFDGRVITLLSFNEKFSKNMNLIVGNKSAATRCHVQCIDDFCIVMFNSLTNRYQLYNILEERFQIGSSFGNCLDVIPAPLQKAFLVKTSIKNKPTIQIISKEYPFAPYAILCGHKGNHNPWAISKEDHIVASGSDDNSIHIWDLSKTLNPDNNNIQTTHKIKTHGLIKMDTKALELTINPRGTSLCLIPKSTPDSIIIFDIPTLRQLFKYSFNSALPHAPLTFIDWATDELLIQNKWGQVWRYGPELLALLKLKKYYQIFKANEEKENISGDS